MKRREIIGTLCVGAIVALVIVVGHSIYGPSLEVCNMPVENVNAGDRVNFGAVAATGNITKMLVTINLYPDDLNSLETPTVGPYVFTQRGNDASGWQVYIDADDSIGTKLVGWQRKWSTTPGSWVSNYNVIDTGAWYQVAIYYDGSSVDNDPRFYINGSGHAANREDNTPAGTLVDASSYDLVIGNGYFDDKWWTMDGKWSDARVYDLDGYSFTEAQVDALVESIHGLKSMRFHGIYPVFRCRGNGPAKGLQAYDGVSLAEANTLVDDIEGVFGTPYGSPTARDETFLAG